MCSATETPQGAEALTSPLSLNKREKKVPIRPYLLLKDSMQSTANPSLPIHRRIAIAVDLSDESASAVKWAVSNYLRPGDAVVLLHVRPTSVLYGADWGSTDLSDDPSYNQKLEAEFDNFTTTKAQELAQPLVEAGMQFKIHIVKDHDMKERLCLEVERMGCDAVIMGSKGAGATRSGGSSGSGKGDRLGSVSDYCVHHCFCPVVVVRNGQFTDTSRVPVLSPVHEDLD